MTKPRTGSYLNCLQCNKECYIPKNRLSKFKYCSRSCGALYVRTQIEKECDICGTIFQHISSRANKAKYCSRKCYYKSETLEWRGTKEFTCKHCHKKFMDSPCKNRIYCSKSCVNKGSKLTWKSNFTTVRKNMLTRGLIKVCNRCGYDKHPNILGVHHIDRNRDNNELTNLEILCPNCHSLEHSKHIVTHD